MFDSTAKRYGAFSKSNEEPKMRIKLFGYTIALTISKSDLVAEVERLAKTYAAYNAGATKLARIKAYRTITGAFLKESKDWVESHFAD